MRWRRDRIRRDLCCGIRGECECGSFVGGDDGDCDDRMRSRKEE